MTLDPHGPAALIAKATGQRPLWGETERHKINGDNEAIWVYTPPFLNADEVQHLSALTDPRVGWIIDIRPMTNTLRIRARRKDDQ